MDFLKKHWGSVASVAGPLIVFLTPSLSTYMAAHPKTLLGTIIGALLAFYNATAPKDKT